MALALTGCTAPLTPDTPPPAPSPTTSAWDEIEAGDDAEVEGDPEGEPLGEYECLDVPEALTGWLAEHSWEYSKTRPAGAGKMVAAGGDWFIAAIPTTGDFDVKGWAWVPGPNDTVGRIMPLPADWDELVPGDEPLGAEYYKAKLPIEDGAYTAAMECIGG